MIYEPHYYCGFFGNPRIFLFANSFIRRQIQLRAKLWVGEPFRFDILFRGGKPLTPTDKSVGSRPLEARLNELFSISLA